MNELEIQNNELKALLAHEHAKVLELNQIVRDFHQNVQQKRGQSALAPNLKSSATQGSSDSVHAPIQTSLSTSSLPTSMSKEGLTKEQ